MLDRCSNFLYFSFSTRIYLFLNYRLDLIALYIPEFESLMVSSIALFSKYRFIALPSFEIMNPSFKIFILILSAYVGFSLIRSSGLQ